MDLPCYTIDSCLLSNLCWNTERVSYHFQRRSQNNSFRTSFDFKSFLPVQLSGNVKISPSSLEFYPMTLNILDHDEQNVTSAEESENEIESILSPKLDLNTNDEFLMKLAEWDPNNYQSRSEINDDDGDDDDVDDDNHEKKEIKERIQTDLMNLSETEIPTADVDDLFVIYSHYPVKSEPVIYADTYIALPQLDGQNDFLFNYDSVKTQRDNRNAKLNKALSNNNMTKSDSLKQSDISSNNMNTSRYPDETVKRSRKKKSESVCTQQSSSLKSNNSTRKLRTLSERKINTLQNYNFTVMEQKVTTANTTSTSISLDSSAQTSFDEINQPSCTKNLSSSKRKQRMPPLHNGKTIQDYFKVTNHPTTQDTIKHSSNVERQVRPENYFDGCISIDDDDDDDDIDMVDTQEIASENYSISTDIHTREKLLDHSVHSSSMRMKWLRNLELLLLEHTSLCYQKNICPSNEFYDINPSFISIIILNFLNMFIIRDSDYSEDEFSFLQFSLTSHLRYLLLDLPTCNHTNEMNCTKCHEYSLILQELFDLLFDLIEYDLCGIMNKKKYRSKLIEEDYFNEFIEQKTNTTKKTNRFFRIKLVIYFIELIELHRRKCSYRNQFVFHQNEDKIFQWIEDSIRQIVYQDKLCFNLTHRKFSIVFNVIELCVLFSNERIHRIRQMAVFLAKLCEENPTCVSTFLFDENLLIDIRLLLINEFIRYKYNKKLISVDDINEFFHCVQNQIDDESLLLMRSLFSTFADLMIEIKDLNLPISVHFEQITSILRNQLDVIYFQLTNLAQETNDNKQIQRSKIFFRLLHFKWKQL
ncbi:hypothetical protein I4U23_024190 [Adineta vaga]|nr:hypothetical protein I4U23_024190 [Adineta vaga]